MTKPASPLIGPSELAGRLRDPSLRVLDGSWYLPNTGRDGNAEFLQAHVPGARFFDLDVASDADTRLPHMLPEAGLFASYVSALGIGDGDLVVVYDGSGANLSAARIWWMFRVFGHDRVLVLDGGFPAWRREGHPVETGEPAAVRQPAEFTARLDPAAIRTMAEVQAAVSSRSAQVVDMRSKGRFRGSDPEPRAGLPSGHIPGALNLPYSELVDDGGCLLAPPLLRARLEEAGLDLGRPIIASCGSGVSACALLLALNRLGVDGAALYDGSWTEWAGAGMPVERGDQPGLGRG